MEDYTTNPIIKKSDELAHQVFMIAKGFPKEEAFGLTSQLKRAALSIPLNIIEGFARKSDKSYRQFLLISYGSLKETKYLLDFCKKEKLITEEEYSSLMNLADDVGKLLWNHIKRLSERC